MVRSARLDGALFADEVDFMRDVVSEARRYYCNIVGKYGVQVQTLLKKAAPWKLETVALCMALYGAGISAIFWPYIKSGARIRRRSRGS